MGNREKERPMRKMIQPFLSLFLKEKDIFLVICFGFDRLNNDLRAGKSVNGFPDSAGAEPTVRLSFA